MQGIIPLLQGSFAEVKTEDVEAAEKLCEDCTDFHPDTNII